jgi:hypothetical protein
VRFSIFFLLLIWLPVSLAACQGAGPISGTSTPEPAAPLPQAAMTATQIVPSPEDVPEAATSTPEGKFEAAAVTPSPSLQPEEPSRALYRLSAVLDYGQHHLAVEEVIIYPNRSIVPIPDLLLVIEPTRYPQVFRLKGLTWEDGEAIEDYTLQVGTLHITLPDPLPPGESLEISLSYELNLPSPSAAEYGRPVPFGYSARQTNLVDWYPFLPPYVPGKGWQVNPAGYFGEHQVYEAADYQVAIRLSGGRQEVILAASAPAELEGDEYIYKHFAARNFAWSASDQYQVSSIQAGGVTVWAYTFPFDAAAGEAALQTTAQALALFSELFGPYPHKTLSVVEADFLDGMEYDGLFFLSKGFYSSFANQPADYLTAIAAHETAHQWWYGLVGNDQAYEPWLDEALATYSERLYYERYYPEALDWWWTYRIQYYQPGGRVDGSIYNPAGFRAYRDAVYLNGALFLEDLRKLTGEEAFFAFLKDYANRYARQAARGEDFFALLGEYSREDLQPLLSEYFSDR